MTPYTTNTHTHHINALSKCGAESKGHTQEHLLAPAYQFDCIRGDGRPRWLVMQVCRRCAGCYALDFTYERPSAK